MGPQRLSNTGKNGPLREPSPMVFEITLGCFVPRSQLLWWGELTVYGGRASNWRIPIGRGKSIRTSSQRRAPAMRDTGWRIAWRKNQRYPLCFGVYHLFCQAPVLLPIFA
jgi:hypothetical protein